MTARERLLTVMKGGIPECVPVAPDLSFRLVAACDTGVAYAD